VNIRFDLFYWCLVTAGALLFAFVLLPVLFTASAVFLSNSSIEIGVNPFNFRNYSSVSAAKNFGAIKSDTIFYASFWLTIVTAFTVSTLVAFSSAITSYYTSRVNLYNLSKLKILPFFAYLTPPVILVLSVQSLPPSMIDHFPKILIVGLSHCAYFFPFSYALFLGYWEQSDFGLDRSAAGDGGTIHHTFILHFLSFKSPTFIFALSISLLTFMLSWSDVLFSRILLGSGDTRLLTDWFIDMMQASEIEERRGELAAMAILTFFLASLLSILFSVAFSHVNRGRE